MTMQTIPFRQSLLSIAGAGLVASLPILGVIALERGAEREDLLASPLPAIGASADANGCGDGPLGMMVPTFHDGRVQGLKVFGDERQYFSSGLGLQSGDILLTINGIAPTTPDALLAAWKSLREHRHASIEFMRDGQLATLTRVLDEDPPAL